MDIACLDCNILFGNFGFFLYFLGDSVAKFPASSMKLWKKLVRDMHATDRQAYRQTNSQRNEL